MLAGLPQAPSRYSPLLNFQRAKERQRYVLKRMVEEQYLSPPQAQAAEQLPLVFTRTSDLNGAIAPHLIDMVRKFLYQNYGSDFVLQAGLTVWTTIESGFQKAAREAVENGTRADLPAPPVLQAAAANPPGQDRGLLPAIGPVERQRFEKKRPPAHRRYRSNRSGRENGPGLPGPGVGGVPLAPPERGSQSMLLRMTNPPPIGRLPIYSGRAMS